MKNIISKLFLVYVFTWLLLLFLLFYPLFRWYLANPARYHKAHKLRVWWGKLLFITCFVRKKIYYEEKFDPDKLYVIVSNHSSYLDIASLAVAVPVDFNYMAKIELARVPLFGIFFRTIDIAVDRKDARQSANAFSKANNQLSNKVRSIAIFPEGGIKKIAPKLSPFKDGACKMAVENQVYILPVTLPDNHSILYSNANGAWPGTMRVYIHKAIDTTGMNLQDVPALTKKCFDIINSKFDHS